MSRLVEKQIDGTRIVGYSLGGEETVVVAPEYNVCFDVGRAPREIIAIDNVCLSHGHMDHAAGIAYYFSQRTFVGIAAGRVIVHRALAPAIRKLLDIWAEIEGHVSPAEICAVEPMQDVAIRRGLLVRPFAVNHPGPCLGFTLIEVRSKLRPEYHGKTGPELVGLKRGGVEIEQRVEVPLITYTGDTAVGPFLNHDFVRHSRLVLMECTFFDREHTPRAKAGRHIHVDDLPKVLAAIPESRIMLIHMTRRTDLRQAKRMIERVLKPDDLARVSLLMDRPARERTDRSASRGMQESAAESPARMDP